jgi:hypothetical protein
MVKHSVSLMRRFFPSASIGGPQFAAAALLGVYLLQCVWLAYSHFRTGQHDEQQALRIYQGLQQWRGGPVAGTAGSVRFEGLPPAQLAHASGRQLEAWSADRSPLYSLIAAAPFVLWPNQFMEAHPLWRWLALTPYLFFGVMLGGSLWYVARRLYGNRGGYIALALYCFSPATIIHVAANFNQAEMGGVWGAFGAVWTGIAVAHTLYAPREVVLWNWRRVLLLGLSFALAVGHQFSLVVVIPAALLLMLWVAPVRRQAVLAIWGAACGVGLILLLASYFFRFQVFWQAMGQARFFSFEPRAFLMPLAYTTGLRATWEASPALVVALPTALITYFWWRRAQYFGNTAPLLMAALFLALGIASPELPAGGFPTVALIFLFVFVAGVFADLLETRHGWLVTAALGGLLIASTVWNLFELARL